MDVAIRQAPKQIAALSRAHVNALALALLERDEESRALNSTRKSRWDSRRIGVTSWDDLNPRGLRLY